MTRGWVGVAGLLLVMPLLAGCLDDPGESGSDCNGRIRWEGVVYTPHNQVNDAAPRGARLGRGDVLDCDGSKVETVELFAIDGVDSSLAIKAVGEWRAVYVAEAAPMSSWPDVLKVR